MNKIVFSVVSTIIALVAGYLVKKYSKQYNNTHDEIMAQIKDEHPEHYAELIRKFPLLTHTSRLHKRVMRNSGLPYTKELEKKYEILRIAHKRMIASDAVTLISAVFIDGIIYVVLNM